MQSRKEDTSRKLEEMEYNLHEGAPQAPIDSYLLGRFYSILGIRPRHTGLPGQAFVRLVGTTALTCAIMLLTNTLPTVSFVA
jgi:hypothetical protein